MNYSSIMETDPKPLELKPATYEINDNNRDVYNEDANELIKY